LKEYKNFLNGFSGTNNKIVKDDKQIATFQAFMWEDGAGTLCNIWGLDNKELSYKSLPDVFDFHIEALNEDSKLARKTFTNIRIEPIDPNNPWYNFTYEEETEWRVNE
jgi:hypothetical protein